MQRSTKIIFFSLGLGLAGFAGYRLWLNYRQGKKATAEVQPAAKVQSFVGTQTTENKSFVGTQTTEGKPLRTQTTENKSFVGTQTTENTNTGTSAKVNLETNIVQSKGYQPLSTQIVKPNISIVPKVGVNAPQPPTGGVITNYRQGEKATAEVGNCWDSEDPWDCGQSTQLTGLAVHYNATCLRTLQLFSEALLPYQYKARFVLEPSAGYGDVAQVAVKSCPDAQVHCLEIEPDLVGLLLDKGFAVKQADFLNFNTGLKYDVICMNPPYNTPDDREAWKKHFFKALYLLQPDCVLICSLPVVAKSMLQSIDKQLFTILQATEYEKLDGGKSLFLKVTRLLD
jgi:hypothetical protein